MANAALLLLARGAKLTHARARSATLKSFSLCAQFLGYTKPQEGPSEPTRGDPAAPLQLISFAPPHKSRITGTAFGGKVETVLRLAGIPYVGLKGNVTNPKHAPKHKVRTDPLPGERCVPCSGRLLRPLACAGDGAASAKQSTRARGLQFPTLRHGENTVSDSTEIFKYLLKTFPDKMAMFVPDELERCGSSSSSTVRQYACTQHSTCQRLNPSEARGCKRHQSRAPAAAT